MVVCGLVARELWRWWLGWFCMICCLVCLAGLCFVAATHVVGGCLHLVMFVSVWVLGFAFSSLFIVVL